MTGVFDQITGGPAKDAPEDDVSNDESGNDESNTDIAAIESDITVTGAATEDTAARTEQRLRDVSQELLRCGLLEANQKPNLYRVAAANMSAVNAILEPFDLLANIDGIRGLVFLTVLTIDDQAAQDEWSHALVRRQRLTLEQSLLVAILRQHFVAHEQEAGIGASQSVVAVDDLIPQLQDYLGGTGSEARERERALRLLDQLKAHGLVSEPDVDERVTIRPIIAHLANPENLLALLHQLQQLSAQANAGLPATEDATKATTETTTE